MQQKQKEERPNAISIEEYLKIRKSKRSRIKKPAYVYIGGQLILENKNGKY